MSGRLIVIEGLDGSGKQTQAELLRARLPGALKISFPDYQSPSSSLIKMYLNGEFGEDADDVNCYAASTFYAVDRFASYAKNWRQNLDNGALIIADRYVTSNMIHQGCKADDLDKYLNWLADFEYNLLALPKPDEVIFLKVPPPYAALLRQGRAQKFDGSDIHERDFAYLEKCYETALYAAEKYSWHVVDCIKDGTFRSKEEICDEIFGLLSKK